MSNFSIDDAYSNYHLALFPFKTFDNFFDLLKTYKITTLNSLFPQKPPLYQLCFVPVESRCSHYSCLSYLITILNDF